MKNNKLNILKTILISSVLFMSCERDLSEEVKDATYPDIAAVFTDDFVGMGSDFYFPYGGSKPTAWSVDRQTGYNSKNSMRVDVPNANDPAGSYAGAILRVDGAGRNLTKYDALTFYVKASQGVTIAELGFGEDFFPNKYITTITNVSVGTNWTKVIIPIPDASKLVKERGMFRYAMGTQNTGGNGYTVWFDEIRFEKLGTIVQNSVNISNGTNVIINTFVGVASQVQNINASFNMPNGINLPVSMSAGYFTFSSSNSTVASVDDTGKITSLAAGTSIITAKLNGNPVSGSVTINCQGAFVHAPTPTHTAANVISIFSNHYNNVPVNYYNGYWQPWQTTVSNDFSVNNDNILNYTIFNFVGIEFSSPTVNATSKTHFHADFFFPGTIAPGRQLRVIIVDFGANGVFGGGDDTRHSTTFTAPTLVSQSWVSIDIPFSAMPMLASRSNLGQIIFEGGDGSVMYADNIYFYNL
jgi:Bacterial Ig-like domain (group 2)